MFVVMFTSALLLLTFYIRRDLHAADDLARFFRLPQSESIQFRVGLPVGAVQILQPGMCVAADFPLWPPAFIPHFQKMAPLRCGLLEDNWVEVDNGTIIISPKAVMIHGDIHCEYMSFTRLDDYKITWGKRVADMKSGSPIQTDFFRVKCQADDNATYKNTHAAIARKQELVAPPGSHQEASGMNILMIAFDSVSRLTWMRNLPRTYHFLVTVLGGVVLNGYNIVGDDTPAALLPILTGRTEQELPNARRHEAGARHIDEHPWIWKDLKKLGYVTQYGVDRNCCNTFTNAMLGFKAQPVDHYFLPYTIETKHRLIYEKPLCAGSLPRHMVFFNYARQLFRTYPRRTRKFSFLLHTELSHAQSDQLQLADDDMTDFLQDMYSSGYLDDTVLVVMSDHGARYSFIRYTLQGNTAIVFW